MSVTADIVAYVQEAIRRSNTLVTISGTVLSVYPFKVLWDGATGPVSTLIMTNYAPSLQDRVIGIKVANRVVCLGSWTNADGAYAGKFVQYNLTSDLSYVTGSYDFVDGYVDENSDDSWILDTDGSGNNMGFLATPQVLGTWWRANVSARFQTSTASASSSWFYVAAFLVYRDSDDNLKQRRVCVAEEHGHAASTEKCWHGVGSAFYVPYPPSNHFVMPKVDYVFRSSLSGTLFAETNLGAQETPSPFGEAGPATYMQLERVR